MQLVTLQFIQTDRLKKIQTSLVFIEKENEVSIAGTKHADCVRFKSIYEDLSAKKRNSNPDPMLLDAIEFPAEINITRLRGRISFIPADITREIMIQCYLP